MNEHDTNRGTIVVKDGTFKNFNPTCYSSEGTNTNFLANGYKVTDWNASTDKTVAKYYMKRTHINQKTGGKPVFLFPPVL
ncbi:MAG: hypothetical protein IJB61_09155 [Bacteroides sp]|nr:hypothetical protein [Bacteroides sp.]